MKDLYFAKVIYYSRIKDNNNFKLAIKELKQYSPYLNTDELIKAYNNSIPIGCSI